jgi:hypothetical protein
MAIISQDSNLPPVSVHQQAQYEGSWDYRNIDGFEVWIVDTKKVDRP